MSDIEKLNIFVKLIIILFLVKSFKFKINICRYTFYNIKMKFSKLLLKYKITELIFDDWF